MEDNTQDNTTEKIDTIDIPDEIDNDIEIFEDIDLAEIDAEDTPYSEWIDPPLSECKSQKVGVRGCLWRVARWPSYPMRPYDIITASDKKVLRETIFDTSTFRVKTNTQYVFVSLKRGRKGTASNATAFLGNADTAGYGRTELDGHKQICAVGE